jgi:hypothetical protein
MNYFSAGLARISPERSGIVTEQGELFVYSQPTGAAALAADDFIAECAANELPLDAFAAALVRGAGALLDSAVRSGSPRHIAWALREAREAYVRVRPVPPPPEPEVVVPEPVEAADAAPLVHPLELLLSPEDDAPVGFVHG